MAVTWMFRLYLLRIEASSQIFILYGSISNHALAFIVIRKKCLNAPKNIIDRYFIRTNNSS